MAKACKKTCRVATVCLVIVIGIAIIILHFGKPSLPLDVSISPELQSLPVTYGSHLSMSASVNPGWNYLGLLHYETTWQLCDAISDNYFSSKGEDFNFTVESSVRSVRVTVEMNSDFMNWFFSTQWEQVFPLQLIQLKNNTIITDRSPLPGSSASYFIFEYDNQEFSDVHIGDILISTKNEFLVDVTNLSKFTTNNINYIKLLVSNTTIPQLYSTFQLDNYPLTFNIPSSVSLNNKRQEIGNSGSDRSEVYNMNQSWKWTDSIQGLNLVVEGYIKGPMQVLLSGGSIQDLKFGFSIQLDYELRVSVQFTGPVNYETTLTQEIIQTHSFPFSNSKIMRAFYELTSPLILSIPFFLKITTNRLQTTGTWYILKGTVEIADYFQPSSLSFTGTPLRIINQSSSVQMSQCDLHIDTGFALEVGLNFFGNGLTWQRRIHGWYDTYTPSYQYKTDILADLHGSILPDCSCSLLQYGYKEQLCNTQRSWIFGTDAITQFNYNIWGFLSGTKSFQTDITQSMVISSECVNSKCPPELFLCNKSTVSCDPIMNGSGKFWNDCANQECRPFYYCKTDDWKCIVTTGSAPFSDLGSCQLSCPKYRCSSEGQCIADSYGPYDSKSLSVCQQNCKPRYNCGERGTCVKSSTGKYASVEECLSKCSCNTCGDPSQGCCTCPYHKGPCAGSCSFTCPGDFMACCMNL